VELVTLAGMSCRLDPEKVDFLGIRLPFSGRHTYGECC